MRSPIVWFGGKGNLVKKLLPYITDHREYIEPFFGGGSVFFAKQPAKVETINDLNSNVMNFFRVLRDEPEEFLRLASLTPYSRELFHECWENYQSETNQVRRAWMWFVVARMSFSGKFGVGGISTSVTESRKKMASTCSKFLSTVDALPQVIERLKRTQIENTSALTAIERYTTPTSLCYCDPPYVAESRRAGGYDHEMTTEDHEALLSLLKKTPGKVLISGYPSQLYTDILSDWRRVDFETACHAAGRTRTSNLQGKGTALKHQARTECLWLNAEADKAVAKQGNLF